ncbi:hypothetical protein [Segetibacter aerophilus]|uniref:YD repeat-containing protein n=1 Tax=Segetibacter aerophilus TaxID=670293 RepID=A0A512B861_9BACT|nr:hypothetical protein [Segetibacter aerophilus]GEO08151.1 hypothetical protein SAE01_06470 [Segetibacter aerophilus]
MKKILFVFICLVLFWSCAKEYSYEGGRRRDTAIPPPLVIVDTVVKDTSDGAVKDSVSIPVEDTSFLVKHYIEKRGNQVDEYDFNYDSKGRLISRISTSGNTKYVYRYNSDNTFTVDYYKGAILASREQYFLNSQNLVDSIIQINYATKDTTSEKNTYNNSSLVQVKEYTIKNGSSVLTNTTTAEYDANGNVTREYSTYGNQIAYQYTNLPYNLNIGLNYFSRNKNLIQTSTYSGSRNLVLKHTYTFDSHNRLTSETVTDSNGNMIVTKIYSY